MNKAKIYEASDGRHLRGSDEKYKIKGGKMRKTLIAGILFLTFLAILVVASYSASADVVVDHGNRVAYIEGGVNVTMWDIVEDASVTYGVLQNQTGGVWLLNYSLQVNETNGLQLSPSTCSWLKIDSSNTTYDAGIINKGTLWINDTNITGWDSTGGANATYNGSYRPYILSRNQGGQDASLYAVRSTFGYLGSNSASKYGVTIRGVHDRQTFDYCTFTYNYRGLNVEGTDYVSVNYSTFTSNNYEAIHIGNGSSINNSNNCHIYSTTINNVSNASAIGIHMGYVNDSFIMANITGISASGTGISINLSDSSRINISSSDIGSTSGSECGQYGVYFVRTEGSTLSDVDPTYMQYGFFLNDVGSNLNTFTNCDPSYMTIHGIHLATAAHNNTFITCDPSYITNGTSAPSGIFLDGAAIDNTFIGCEPTYCSHGFYIDDSNENVITSANVSYCNYSIYFNDATGSTTVTDFTATNPVNNTGSKYSYDIYLSDTSNNNTFYNTALTGSTDATNHYGLYATGTTRHNTFTGLNITYKEVALNFTSTTSGNYEYTITNCIIDNSGTGLMISGEDFNHTFTGLDINSPTAKGVYMIAYGTRGSPVNHTFTNLSVTSPGEEGIYLGNWTNLTGLAGFTDSITTGSTTYNVRMENRSQALFTRHIGYGATTYDYKFGDTTNATLTSYYVIDQNNSVDTTVSVGDTGYQEKHACGDGIVNYTTRALYIRPDCSTSTVNVTSWGTNKEWTVSATAGNLTQYVSPGSGSWNVLIDNQTRDRQQSGWFYANWTGGWSLHTFTLAPYTSPGGGPGGGPGGDEPTYITCYRCNNGQLESTEVALSDCPSGWYSSPPSCGEPDDNIMDDEIDDFLNREVPGFELVLVIVAIGAAMILLRRKRPF